MAEPSRAIATPQSARSKNMKVVLPPQAPLQQREDVLKNGHLSLDTFSPVNQNGSFEFDRVLKSGNVMKRTKKTKTWKRVHIVLRPNLLSFYKDAEETKLRHQIHLSELTAVARQKDPKGKAQHLFCLFSPSRNFHLEAPSDKEAQEWVDLIRREARIDEEEEEMILASPTVSEHAHGGLGRQVTRDHVRSSSSEPERRGQSSLDEENVPMGSRPFRPQPRSQPMGEAGSYSDFSDGGGIGYRDSSHSIPRSVAAGSTPVDAIYGKERPTGSRNASQLTGFGQAASDEERVICHGWLTILKSKGGVRQWKKHWVVLRPKTFALYKNQEEYAAHLIIPTTNILDAVDIDPVGKHRPYCMQLITDERNYRLCAPDEDALATWLGALKSLVVKRKEARKERPPDGDKERKDKEAEPSRVTSGTPSSTAGAIMAQVASR